MSLIDYLPKVQGSYRENALLSKTNWFKVGGPAEVLYKPKNTEDLIYFFQNKPKDIPYLVIGCGSNLIVRDGGVKGVVIKLGQEFTHAISEGENIRVGAGCLSYNLAMFALNNGIGGMEFLSGIPGTIGGNIAMNAGAYGGDIESILINAKAVDDKGSLHVLSPEDMGFIYRGNNVPESWIFFEATLKGYKEDPNVIKGRIDEIARKRSATQPIKEKTSGSTFKNHADYSAWKLIDEAGCRGLRIGGAIISEKHCNFLINDQNATAKDIEDLGEEVRRRVFEKSGIQLEWEIKRIGN